MDFEFFAQNLLGHMVLQYFILRFLWSVNGSPLESGQDVIQSLDAFSSSLSFTSLKRGHSGNYTCEAVNAASTDRFTAELVVNGKLLFSKFLGYACLLITKTFGQLTRYGKPQSYTCLDFKKYLR